MPVVTISPSSATSLREIGLRGPCYVIPMAVDEAALESVSANPRPHDVVVIARLTPSKRIEHCIRAAQLLVRRGWAGKLHILGDGKAQYVKSLRTLGRRLLGEQVFFHGKVSDERRRALLTQVSLLWATSAREGWGLVVTEAARRGTPAVVYDVPGLRDAVRDGITGFVVPPTPQDLAEATLEIFTGRYRQLAANALTSSREYSWDRTTDAFEAALRQTIDQWKLRN